AGSLPDAGEVGLAVCRARRRCVEVGRTLLGERNGGAQPRLPLRAGGGRVKQCKHGHGQCSFAAERRHVFALASESLASEYHSCSPPRGRGGTTNDRKAACVASTRRSPRGGRRARPPLVLGGVRSRQ